ncbi:hypothetical protein LCGC14_2634230 [marine sediment metagenome]|uniref:Phage major capsid protein n=1 Tax=marine sediment metagenome TaxID=412755 RepID=A0A0F9CAA2_9ZZZZ
MSLTLVEGSKRSNDILQLGVVELLVKDDPILERLGFKDIKGNGLTYNVESTLSGAQFYAVNEEWNESTSTVTQTTAHTTILGGDADVDNYLETTRGNLQDLMAEQVEAKTKAIRRTFLDTFWYGYKTTETKRFDGMHQLLTSETYNTIANGTSGTPVLLNMTKLEELIDLIVDGKPDLLVMTKLMRRSINKYLHGVGGITYSDAANGRIQTLFEVPVAVSDHLSNDESCDKNYGNGYGHDPADGTALGTDENGTTIFALQFGPKACSGVQSLPITVTKFSKLEGKDGKRTRIKWYPGIMCESIISCAKLTGVAPTGTVAA